jgi:hypothetical protein
MVRTRTISREAGKPEPSEIIPSGSTLQANGNGSALHPAAMQGDDMIPSSQQCEAALVGGRGVASHGEDNGRTKTYKPPVSHGLPRSDARCMNGVNFGNLPLGTIRSQGQKQFCHGSTTKVKTCTLEANASGSAPGLNRGYEIVCSAE